LRNSLVPKTYFDIFFRKTSNSSPDLNLRSFLDITTETIDNLGIRGLIIDLDQTVVIQGTSEIPKDYLPHLLALINHIGKDNICFLTNEPNADREKKIKRQTGITVVSGNFRKPDERAYRAAITFLKTDYNKKIAMIGDRLWTDIVGANRLGLFTIKVKPISPQLDSTVVSLVRKGEDYSASYGRKKLFQIFLAVLTLAGMGVIEFTMFMKDLVKNTFVISDTIFPYLPYIHLIFLFAVLFLYFKTLIKNVNISEGEYKNNIIYLFNTYPAFFRFGLSWFLIIISFVKPTLFPENFLRIAVFYSFAIHIGLLASLWSYYHSYTGRILSIFFDLFTVTIIIRSLPLEFRSYFLILYLIPVGTAARYFHVCGISVVTMFCSISAYLLLDRSMPYSSIYIAFFLITAGVLKVEYLETTKPIDSMAEYLFRYPISGSSILSMLKKFLQILHCTGVYYVKSRSEGYYFLIEDHEFHGKIAPPATEEIFNYLVSNKENIIDQSNTDEDDLRRKQKNIKYGLFSLLRPYPIKGVVSVIAVEIPHNANQFIVFVNNLTRNGVTRRSFSVRHARTIYIIASLISLFNQMQSLESKAG